VLVTDGGPLSTGAEISRLRLAQALLGYLAAFNDGTLLLITDEDAPLESRVQLLSTAGNLAQQLRGTNISVSVRFGTLTDSEPPQEITGSVPMPALRRSPRQPPPQSGQMLKPSLVPSLHKSPAIPLQRRKMSEAG
jgi:hypothetical protein